MSRDALKVRIARSLQRVPLAPLRRLERPFVRRRLQGEASGRQIILLALPRSGSTLTYQALVHSFDAYYLSNFGNLLYQLPFHGALLSRMRCHGHRSDFHSSEGFVPGLCGPAEGMRFWSYWLGNGLDECVDEAGRDRKSGRERYIREVFTALGAPGRPVITGYLGHALIAEHLRTIFPDAVFVRLHRDVLDNARSLLRSRGGSKQWFSVRPRECCELADASPHEQVAAQVYWLNRRLEVMDTCPRTFHVTYESLCRDPNTMMERLIEFAGERGMSISPRAELPAHFGDRRPVRNDDEDGRLLAAVFSELEARNGALSRRVVD